MFAMRLTKAIILSIPLALSLSAETDPPGRVGRLNYTSGPVSFQPAGLTDWVDADVNRPLTAGDQVWVGNGARAEVHVGSTALRLESNTAFQFLNLDDQTIQIQLSQGTLTVRARTHAQDQNLEVDTPSVAFTVLGPGKYRIDANPDSETTTVTVRDGDGEVTGGGQTFPVHGGQQAIAVGGDQITYNLLAAPRADGWDQWNSSRDRNEDESLSAHYVSREVDGYEDLDQYGSWANQPGYGQVWMPTAVADGWAPYHDGHWAWIAPWGWTWVDDAPWGFAPYHYGRWASFGGRWAWVPGPYGVTPLYAPALVSWIGGGRGGSEFSLSFASGNAAAIGWFPLGPREPYIPAYKVSSDYFGRVNSTNTVINSTTINNYYNESQKPNPVFENLRYANRNVQNAVTAVPQDRFASGRRVTESARSVPGSQLDNARFAAAPEIAPQRASVLGPRAGEASRAPRPPARALGRPVVARTAPPPAPVPFSQQQAELNRNPGRPLPPATIQQIGRNAPARSSPVRVEDMSRVQRVEPIVGAGPQQGARRSTPIQGRPGDANPEPENVVQRPNAAPSPVVGDRQNESPSRPAARQDGRSAVPVARPDSAAPNVPRPQNAPAPDAVRQPNTAPPTSVGNRQNESPSDRADRQNDRRSAPIAKPENPPPNVAPQQIVPAPGAVRQPNTPAPTSDRLSASPPNRQQPELRDRAAQPSQPNRTEVQNPRPPEQLKKAPAEIRQPSSRTGEPKAKPDKNEEKK